MITLEGPVLVSGLGKGGVEGLEAAVVVMVMVVLIVAAGENLRGRLGGHGVAEAAGVVVFLVVLLLRLLGLPRADDGVDAQFSLLLGAAGGRCRMEKTPLVLTPAKVIVFLTPALLLFHHWCHELLLLPLVAVAHAVDEAVEHGEVGPLGGDGVLPKLKF